MVASAESLLRGGTPPLPFYLFLNSLRIFPLVVSRRQAFGSSSPIEVLAPEAPNRKRKVHDKHVTGLGHVIRQVEEKKIGDGLARADKEEIAVACEQSKVQSMGVGDGWMHHQQCAWLFYA